MLNRRVLVIEVLVLVIPCVLLVRGTREEAGRRGGTVKQVGRGLVRVVAGQGVRWLVVGGVLGKRGGVVVGLLLLVIEVVLREVVVA